MEAQIEVGASPFAMLQEYVNLYRARKEARVLSGTDTDSYLAFSAGDECYLLSMAQVLEVATQLDDITPLPFSPFWLLGLTSHRGNIYSVVDFKYFANKKLRSAKNKSNNSYMLLRDVGQGYILKVDFVHGIRSCDVGLLQSQYGWIDGHAHMDDRDWLRINLANLAADASFIQSMQ